ncbi:MAG: P22 coat - protein 5 family protein [Gammaproteobacteria bacterium]|nr:P22 coat - protein 5 family protein [Gammaproteobacteria bacterium]
MANTLTNLLPDLYAALDVVSREMTGLIPSVTMDARIDRAAKGQSVYIPIAPANAAGEDISPTMTLPVAADQTIGNTSVVISKARSFPFSWNGNEQGHLSTGVGYLPIRANQMLQAMRAAVNEVEADLSALQKTFSRAYGTPTTTPFGTAGDFTDATQTLKILKDNGAPLTDNQLVVNTAAGANFLGKQSSSSVQFNDSVMRQGVFMTTSGMDIRESSFIQTQTAGAMANATTLAADALTVGQTTINLATAGTGVVAAGDIITLANDTNKYVVTSVTFAGVNPAAGDSIVIAAPGIKVAQAAGARAITVTATSARNMAFNRSAIILATRMPERPQEGDMALDVTSITDPRTGLTFEVAIYPGHRMIRYEISLAWGVKNIKPEHTALLIG